MADEQGSDERLPPEAQQRIRDLLDAERRRLDAEQARIDAIPLKGLHPEP